MEIAIVIVIVYLLLNIADIYYRKNWTKHLGVTAHFNKDHANIGDKIELVECITNNKSIALPYLNMKFNTLAGIRFPSSGEEEKVSDLVYRNDIFSLLFHQKVTRRLPVVCEKRGVYEIKDMEVVTKNVLLTEVLAMKYPQNTKVTVYPRRIVPDGIEIMFHTLMGDDISPRRLYEDPFEFSGIRDYQTYDTISSINWKATAKVGKLQVNQHDQTVDKVVYLIVNIEDEGMFHDDDLHEMGISIAAGLSHTYIKEGYQVGLICNGKNSEDENIPLYMQASGMTQFDRINTGLAQIDLRKTNIPITQLLDSIEKGFFSQAAIILISPYRQNYNFATLAQLCDIRQNGCWIETCHQGNSCKAVVHAGKDMGELLS